MDGILLIDKPAGWTSHDVVAKVRKLLSANGSELTAGRVKVGHTGTLDPAATGLLVLVVGTYCKRAAEFSKLDKVYEVELTLGKTSSTGDREGEITEVSDEIPSEERVKTVLKTFLGKIQQTPPAFSAIKVNGQRAYKLARAGKAVNMEPRTVEIYSLDKTQYAYPVLSFEVSVSSGTYIRSLASDIGEKLGTGAYMSALRRTAVGGFDIKEATSVEAVSVKQLKTIA